MDLAGPPLGWMTFLMSIFPGPTSGLLMQSEPDLKCWTPHHYCNRAQDCSSEPQAAGMQTPNYQTLNAPGNG